MPKDSNICKKNLHKYFIYAQTKFEPNLPNFIRNSFPATLDIPYLVNICLRWDKQIVGDDDGKKKEKGENKQNPFERKWATSNSLLCTWSLKKWVRVWFVDRTFKCLSVSVYLFICLCVPVSVYLCPFICLSFVFFLMIKSRCLFIYLSVCASMTIYEPI